MDSVMDLSNASKALDIENIRFQLIRLEDTITFLLIERVQFPLNKAIYVPGGVKIPNSTLSLMDYLLREQEHLQSRPILYPKILHPNTVNINNLIKSQYINEILPNTCRKFDHKNCDETQENYGSSAIYDINCLQALSRRIHFGKFVAESKFQANPEKFVKLIKAGDRKGIDEAITNIAVEKKVLERVRLKATMYGMNPAGPVTPDGCNLKIDVEAVVTMYKNSVIPMTKIVEVEYLMQRLKGTEWE
ncbi:chorismate mutase [Emergomyces africanus]|uniref:Chorismate mutase n=1 Tax=Emergomyces africanus TaxID=1955775 RepID=A0A1B7NL14_9EURO|nr:chorismate mutase [Emergomyces africanus]